LSRLGQGPFRRDRPGRHRLDRCDPSAGGALHVAGVLGYTFGRYYSPKTGESYLGVRPSAKKIGTICAAISEQTQRRWLFLDPCEMVARLNRMMQGWANYFCRGAVYVVYRVVDTHACFRLRQWLGQRERVQGPSRSRYSEPYLRRTYELVKLEGRRRQRLCANA
jgi:RNA-directed DNA polymerase